ncbi:hypothetical protein HDU96_008308 [Phlyctochytrium bullatum]|nr:hypothetical protein HDU96_008308 [Phlyctochytrium bullatum]
MHQEQQPPHQQPPSNNSVYILNPQPAHGQVQYVYAVPYAVTMPPTGSAYPILVAPVTAAPVYGRWQHVHPDISKLLPADLEPSLLEVPTDGTYVPPMMALPTPADGVPAQEDVQVLEAAVREWTGKYEETVEKIRKGANVEKEMKKQESTIEVLLESLGSARKNLKIIQSKIEKGAKDAGKISFKSLGAKMSGKYDQIRQKEQAELDAAKREEDSQLKVVEEYDTSLKVARAERSRLQEQLSSDDLQATRKELIGILNQAFDPSPTPHSHRLLTTLHQTQTAIKQVDKDLYAHHLAATHVTEALQLLRLAKKQFETTRGSEGRQEMHLQVGDAYGNYLGYDRSRRSAVEAGNRVAAACYAVPKCGKFFWAREQLGTDVQVLARTSFSSLYGYIDDDKHLIPMQVAASALERRLEQALSWLQRAERSLGVALEGAVGISVAWRRTVTAYRVAALGVGREAAGTKGEDVEWLLPGRGVVEDAAVGGSVMLLSG